MRIAPRLLLAVSAGGAAGAVIRHLLSELAPDGPGLPWTTFAINVSGAALLASLALLPAARRSATWAAALGPGLLGGYTTFSAASEQCRTLLASGQHVTAATYAAGTLAACYTAVALARRLARPLPEEESA